MTSGLYLNTKYNKNTDTSFVPFYTYDNNTSTKKSSNIPMVSEEAVQRTANNGTYVERTSSNATTKAVNTKDELTVRIRKMFNSQNLNFSNEQIAQIINEAIGHKQVALKEDVELAERAIRETIQLLKKDGRAINFKNIIENVKNIRTDLAHGVSANINKVNAYSDRINKIMKDRNCSREEALKFLLTEAISDKSDLEIIAKNTWTAIKNLKFGKIFRKSDKSREVMERQTLSNLIKGATTEELKELEATLESLIKEFPDTWGTKKYLVDSIKEQIRKGGNAVAEQVDTQLVTSRQQERAAELAAHVESGVNNEGAKKVDARTENFHNNLEGILAKLNNNQELTAAEKAFLKKYNIPETVEGIKNYLNGTFAEVLSTQIVVASANTAIENETLNTIVQHNTSHQNAEQVFKSTSSIAEEYSSNGTINIEEFNNKINNATNNQYKEYIKSSSNNKQTESIQYTEAPATEYANISAQVNSNTTAIETKTLKSDNTVKNKKSNYTSITDAVSEEGQFKGFTAYVKEVGLLNAIKEAFTKNEGERAAIWNYEIHTSDQKTILCSEIGMAARDTLINHTSYKTFASIDQNNDTKGLGFGATKRIKEACEESEKYNNFGVVRS